MSTLKFDNTVKLKISEIFTSIDGEGARTGLPCIFLRLYGCNLHCSFCDSQYACVDDAYTEMTIQEILDKLESDKIRAVTLTGGEPLLQKGVYDLINSLTISGFWLNIETNGSIDVSQIDHLRYVANNTDVMITMDWKCNGSGMTDKMLIGNLEYLHNCDVLKFVVSDIEDLNQMKELIDSYEIDAQIFVSPVYGKIEPKEIVKFVLDNDLTCVKTQVQLHKIIWDPDQRGV